MGSKKKSKKTTVQTVKESSKSPVNSKKAAVKSVVKSNMSLHPKWRFQKRDCEHERWHLEVTDILLEKLTNFESMTWAQILVEAKKQNHHVKTYELIKEAQKRLTTLKLDDYDEICSLRLDGTHRLYGILDEDGVFSIIWNDFEHEIYPSKKSNT
ncbi:hypothetical protein EFO33_12060 [Lactococcus cremoris]|uniref:Uncharacterized protein n=1 Tax=Lactococcus lactis subsp. cremoris TaxID=1359 RepID=A0A896TAV9_LACLC|nr:hypothetical protein [Lactococcus cremoris]MCT4401083.1 hypothetical protein [Lactococcus cremoris]MCT4429607.1 hypothetical protein [Lactococcus cremoris]MDM7654019.1 hypothetical protein [Lactococcus cremoris]QSD63178.1 hypothetical protein LL1196_1557 [Lactococcus cremoris]UXV62516.1 hypothetical protein LLUC047_07580 [Lactococcus cremoris]